MATKKKTASKGPAKKAATTKKAVKAPKNVAPKKTAKKATPAKKAAPAKAAKKNVTKKAAPAKKAAVKKAAPSKKSTPKKAVAKKAAPAKKVAAKKVAPNKKSVTTKTKATQVKKETKKSTAKAAAPAKKATANKAAAAAPKAVAKKAAPAKKETVAKAAPAKKEVAAKAAPAKKAAAAKAASVTRTAAKATPVPTEKPKPTRRNARDENKQQVIVAHRRLENKSRQAEKAGKTMINYQPEFTRSILDGPVEQQGPVYRYSDEELNEFRVLISGRLEAARKELTYLQGLITRKDEAGTEDTENRYMNMEDGSGAMEREQLAQLASRQIQFINHLEKAMMRIENKTYGICRVTGKLIDKARLRAVPHATLSIEAKKMMSTK